MALSAVDGKLEACPTLAGKLAACPMVRLIPAYSLARPETIDGAARWGGGHLENGAAKSPGQRSRAHGFRAYNGANSNRFGRCTFKHRDFARLSLDSTSCRVVSGTALCDVFGRRAIDRRIGGRPPGKHS